MYLEKSRFQNTLDKLHLHVAKSKSEIHNLFDQVNKESCHLILKESEYGEVTTRNVMFVPKIRDLLKQIKFEKQRYLKLKNAIPSPYNCISDGKHDDVVMKSIQYLRNYAEDGIDNIDSGTSIVREEKTNPWPILDQYLENSCRMSVWKQVLDKQKDLISDMIDQLKQMSTQLAKNNGTRSLNIATTKVEVEELKTLIITHQKQELVGLAKNECDEALSQTIQLLENKLLDVESSPNDADSLITRYVAAFTRELCHKSKMAALNETLRTLKLEETRCFEKHEQLKKLFNDTQQLYSNKDLVAHTLESGVEMLENLWIVIEESIIATEELIKTRFRSENVGLNSNNLSNTTLLDLNATSTYNSLAQYSRELEMFKSVSIKTVLLSLLNKKQTNQEINVFISELKPFPYHTVNILGIEQLCQKLLDWKLAVKRGTIAKLEFNDTFAIETALIMTMNEYHREKILDYLEKSGKTGHMACDTLSSALNKFNVYRENAFDKYVPYSRLYQGRTYLEYRNEYEMFMKLRNKAI